jgi:predicted DNA-binding protein YlxM (UPF0122 family)
VSEDVSEKRLSVGEAAARLGVTRDAIHKRIRRNSIRHEQGEDGRFYVYVDTSTTGADTFTDMSAAARAELLEELRDRLHFVERQLEEERQARTEERRRHDTLMAQLMQRIPELEPPAPPESPEPREPGPYRVRPERAEPVEPVDPRREEPQRVEPERVEPRESSMTAADEQQGRGPVPDTGGPQTAREQPFTPEQQEPRPWWRRIFGPR